MAFYYPPGMIAPFDDACPTGWTRVSGWDDTFVRAAASAGGSGGTATHYHPADPPSGYCAPDGQSNQSVGGIPGDWMAKNTHGHPVNFPSTNSATTSSLPLYVNVVFCKKD
ncbi:MAG: hypothetical protein GY950_04180 [bacterium]|nr:hypothetical protein [bacterium]